MCLFSSIDHLYMHTLRFDDRNAVLDDKSHILDLKTRLIVEDFDQYEVHYMVVHNLDGINFGTHLG